MVFNENLKVSVALKQLLDSAAVGVLSRLRHEANGLDRFPCGLVAANDHQFHWPAITAHGLCAKPDAKWRRARHFEGETIRSWLIEAAAQSMVG